MNRKFWFVAMCFLFSLAWKARATDNVAPPGRQIVDQKCASCHTFSEAARDWPEIARSGGPDLFYAGSKFKKEWLQKWLREPSRIRPAGYLPFRYVESTPAGDVIDETKLPSHPALGANEVSPVVEYLLSLRKELNPYPMANAATAIRAEVHFQKILPCAGCHRAGDLKGGISGPELASAAERMNRDWLFSFIADPEYWTKELMPKVSLRADQLSAIGEYLLDSGNKHEEPGTAGPAANIKGNAAVPRPLPGNRAEMLYQVFCSQCHGIQGNGKGINAPYMFVKPRDHTSFAEMSALTDDRLFAAIKFGGAAVNKSSLMPSWGATLKDVDIQLLVEYLRRLSGTGGAE